MNGAIYLGRDSVIGSIAVGKQADLVIVNGDPSARIEDIRNVELVFKQGVGYDPQKLIASDTRARRSVLIEARLQVRPLAIIVNLISDSNWMHANQHPRCRAVRRWCHRHSPSR